jgi:hypothetical protein
MTDGYLSRRTILLLYTTLLLLCIGSTAAVSVPSLLGNALLACGTLPIVQTMVARCLGDQLVA